MDVTLASLQTRIGETKVRWVLFVLLLLGALFSFRELAPGAFGPDGHSGGVAIAFLAFVAGLFFLAAVVGLFLKAISFKIWSALVIAAVAASFPVYASHFAAWMITPMLVNLVLLGGVLAGRWTPVVARMRYVYNMPARVNPLMLMPVPWVYVLMYLSGVALQFVAPLTVHAATLLFVARVAGTILIPVGGIIAFFSLGIFRAARTTTIPFEAPTLLITRGPYRFTRNPMYLGLMLIYLGVACVYGHIGPILVLPLLLFYVHRVVIPVEESRLLDAFGDEYAKYRARVGRWI